MFSKIIRTFSCFGIVSLFWVGSYADRTVAQTATQSNNQTANQTILEAAETIRLYDKIADGDRVPVITCIDLEKNGNLLAVGGDDQLVRLWDIKAKGFTRELTEHLDWVRGLAFNPNQTRLATLGQDGQIKLWDVQTGLLVRSLKTPVRGGQKILFHPNGSRFAVCGFDKNVRIYDAITGNLLHTLETHGTNNRAIAFSADGTKMAVAGRTGAIRIWQISNLNSDSSSNNYRKLNDFAGDGRRVHAVAFSADGSQLASGGEGPFVIIWNTADGNSKNLPERPGKTFSLVFCGDHYIASGESDNAIRIWDIRQNQNIATLLGHTGTVSTMIYESATNRLITGSFDTSLRFWTLPTDFVPATSVQTADAPTSTPVSTPVSISPSASSTLSPFAEPVNTATQTTTSFPVSF